MFDWQQNLLHAQEFQKQAYNKGVRPCRYGLSEKIQLNSKYTKKKQNEKLNTKIFNLFQVFYQVEKPVYKLKQSVRWKIYNIFYI